MSLQNIFYSIDYLQKPLDDYIKTLPKVRIIRSHRRLGIISNRILGAVNAVGPVLVNVRTYLTLFKPIKT